MNNQPMKARIESITPFTDRIVQLILVPDVYIDYQAGQYLQLISNQTAFYYSIANAPLGSHTYELHIRHEGDLPSSYQVGTTVMINVPLGTCDMKHLHPNKPILFIAGGTGFAPIHAMIEQLLEQDSSLPFELIWGARSQNDLYMDVKIKQWQAILPHFNYSPLLSDPNEETLASVALAHHDSHLHEWQIVISGPFDMVYHARDQLVARGALPKAIFSDAFQFEKNNPE